MLSVLRMAWVCALMAHPWVLTAWAKQERRQPLWQLSESRDPYSTFHQLLFLVWCSDGDRCVRAGQHGLLRDNLHSAAVVVLGAVDPQAASGNTGEDGQVTVPPHNLLRLR